MKYIFAAAALIAGSHLSAQSDTTKTLEQVVVSANKFPNKTALTGKVVHVITRQDIDRAGSRDLAQVINEQGGVYINGANSNPGKDKSIYIRGGRAEHTLITIDGVPVYDASGIGSNFDNRNISIDAVDRIEVLKGSQSTLYGSDAIAGVINIITRKGGTKPVNLSGAVSAGSLGTLRTNLALAGTKNKIDYNAGYSYFTTDGISEAAEPAGSTQRFDRDGYNQKSLHANIGIQAAKILKVQPYLRYTANKGEYDNQGFEDNPTANYNAKNLQVGVRNELTIGAGKLNILYNYNNTDRQYITESSESGYKAGEHFGEAFIVYPLNKIKITAGIDGRSSNMDQTSTLSFIKPLNGDSVAHKQLGAYGAVLFTGAKGLNIEGGLRLNNHSKYGSNAAFNINPSYLIHNQWKIFSNVSTGYKTPSLYQLFSEYGNGDLQPETSLNLEGGLQYFTKDGKASLRATYFKRKVKDLITFFFDPVTFNAVYINRDKQKDNGIELDGKISISDKIHIKAFYSYIDGEITTKKGTKDTTYFNLYRRPRNTLSFTLGTQVTKALFTSLQLQSVSNTTDVTFDPPFFTQRELKLKNYVLMSLYAEYALVKNRFKLFTDLRNITNEKYQEIYGYKAPGFTAYGGIRFNL